MNLSDLTPPPRSRIHWLTPPADQQPLCSECAVRDMALFGPLPGDWLRQAHDFVSALTLPPGQRLLGRGHLGQAVYTVRRGVLRAERYTEDGQRRIVRLAGPGALLGSEALSGLPQVDDLIACTEVSLCRISLGLFPPATERGQAMAVPVLRQLQRDMDAMVQWSVHLTRGSARARLLQLLALLDRHAEADGTAWLPRRDEIGDMLDLTLETASRQFSALHKAGVVQVLSLQRMRVDRAALTAAIAALAD